MRFIAAHTSIPVPKVFCAFTRHGWTYIVMERIAGDMIARGWIYRSAESKANILSQVKQMIQEMRSIPPTDRGIANVDGESLYDGRVAGTSLRFGPFRNAQDFHKHLRRGMEFHPDLYPEVNELIAQHEEPYPSLVFTHGDLSSLNILARRDKVVGIVDWETAGWYPSYWEYTTACQVNPHNSFWRDEIEKFLDPFPKELAMEKLRQKYFGDI
jgi:aminoglycoside phosphotransferase (APT) family kinase protein